jgi:heterodisulfide reductase subunit B2
MRYAFFRGCTIQVKLPYIEKLAREVFPLIGIDLVDMDFSCCPTSRVVRDKDEHKWLLVAARNLAVAEKEGLPVLSMCTGCTQTLKEAQVLLEDLEQRKKINEILKSAGLEYKGEANVVFFAQAIHEIRDRLPIKRKLGLRVASHPGCHILRPSRVLKFDNPENPLKEDELIMALGATAVAYPKKAMCCGFALNSVDPEGAARMMKDKMSTIDADCMAVLCPTCLEYYDVWQERHAGKAGFRPIPVVHYLQLLGLSLGLADVGFSHMRHKDNPFIKNFK